MKKLFKTPLKLQTNVILALLTAFINSHIEELEREKEGYLIKIAAQANRISELAEWKAENAVAIAEISYNKQLLEDKSKQLQETEQLYQDLKREADDLRQKLQEQQRQHEQAMTAERERRLTVSDLGRFFKGEKRWKHLGELKGE